MSRKKASKKGASVRKKRPTKKTVSRQTLRKTAVKRRRARRPLHKKLALHPFNILFLLCVGVLLAAMSTSAIADDFDVTAAVDAPPPTQGAYITSPMDNAILTSTPIEVDGTCPDNTYVVVIRNGETGGVAWCQQETFSIETGLYAGSNVLQAQDYNITNNAGPSTPSITVSYIPPATPTVGSSTASTPETTSTGHRTTVPAIASNVIPLLLTTNFTFREFTTGSKYWTNINVAGGVAPYKIFINWGDGSTGSMNISSASTFTIWHTYTKNGYYSITISATDAAGTEQWLQVAAFIRSPLATSFLTNPSQTNSKPNIVSRIITDTRGWLFVIWPSYLIIVLMVFCFWLGEREAYKKMASRFRGRNKRLKHSWH